MGRLVAGRRASTVLSFPGVAGVDHSGTWLTGEAASQLTAVAPGRVVFGVKGLLRGGAAKPGHGRSCRTLARSAWGGPTCTETPDGGLFLGILSGEGGVGSPAPESVRPVHAAAEILDHARQRAQKALGLPVSRCVIAVPALFGPAEREMIVWAAREARLDVLALIHDGLAMALTRGTSRRASREVLIVVGVGAGFTSVSLMTRDGDHYRELVATGVPLGGENIEDRIAGYLLEEFKRQPGWPAHDRAPLATVRHAAAEAVSRLAWKDTVPVVVLHGGRTFNALLSRSQIETFREPISHYLHQTISRLWQDWGEWARALTGGRRPPVIVSGGGLAATASVRRTLRSVLEGAKVERASPSGSVALGASLWGQALVRGGLAPSSATRRTMIATVAPWTIALGRGKNKPRVIVPAGSTLPHQAAFSGIDLGKAKDGRAVIRLYEASAEGSAGGQPEDFTWIGDIQCQDRRTAFSPTHTEAPVPVAEAAVDSSPRGPITLRASLTQDGRLAVQAQGADGESAVSMRLRYPGLEVLGGGSGDPK